VLLNEIAAGDGSDACGAGAFKVSWSFSLRIKIESYTVV
jgi:hypothetical protein